MMTERIAIAIALARALNTEVDISALVIPLLVNEVSRAGIPPKSLFESRFVALPSGEVRCDMPD
jgi:hypothetical protein